MEELVAAAWAEWDRARCEHPAFVPAASAPVLWFGNRQSYSASRLRVITIGVNPGPQAFPTENPWCGYPLLEGQPRACDTFERAMNEFRLVDWFDDWNPLLATIGAPHHVAGSPSGDHHPLHVDVVPLMTEPTWSEVEKRAPSAAEDLMGKGLTLLAELLDELQPDITLLSLKTGQFQRLTRTLGGVQQPQRTFNRHRVVEFAARGIRRGIWIQKRGREPLSRLTYSERAALGRWIGGEPFPAAATAERPRLEPTALIDLLRTELADLASDQWMDLRGRRVWRRTLPAWSPGGEPVHLSSQATPEAIREFIELWDRDPRCRKEWGRKQAKSVDHVTFPPDHRTIPGLYLRWDETQCSS